VAEPLVLYVHPWELVDFGPGEVRRSPRLFGGAPSQHGLARLRAALAGLIARGTSFVPLDQLARPWLDPAAVAR
jgi:hypothetical protein